MFSKLVNLGGKASLRQTLPPASISFFSTTVKERTLSDALMKEFSPDHLVVTDVSSGCGASFRIEVVSKKFEGVPMVQQQRLVNQTLAEYIADVHSVQLKTQATSKWLARQSK